MKTLKNLTRPYRYTAIGVSILLVVLLIVASVKLLVHPQVQAGTSQFVVRSGTELMLGGNPFRFSGANIYWLGLDQNVGGINYPTDFRIDDALATAQQMGASVVRSHTLGISVGNSFSIEPSLGTFNDVAFQSVDYAIFSAKNHGLRLIIPFTDNWHYYHGGKHTFTDWRGIKDENQFYTNPTVIGDFEQYISYILNHVNSYTGVAYKDDPTILGWETGNGLVAPSSWVQTIAGYIKSIDHNHLVIDGNSGQSYDSSFFKQDLTLKDVDIYTGQYYPLSIAALNTQAALVNKANKVFIAEEYAWNNEGGGDPLSDFLSAIESNHAIAGDLFWSLFSHNDTYGYVQHNDGYTLHYPGDTPDMRNRAQELRIHAYSMKGVKVEGALVPGIFSESMPGDPIITGVIPGLTWRGVAGADKYTIERTTTGPNGSWTVICDQCATDNDTPWLDKHRPAGTVWYRVKAYSLSGVAGNYSVAYEAVGSPPSSGKSELGLG